MSELTVELDRLDRFFKVRAKRDEDRVEEADDQLLQLKGNRSTGILPLTQKILNTEYGIFE